MYFSDCTYRTQIKLISCFVANLSVGCKHTWKHIPGKANQSICTMCNKCCDQGRKCKYNRIMGNNLRECLCKTSSPGCVDCGICIDCAADLWVNNSNIYIKKKK